MQREGGPQEQTEGQQSEPRGVGSQGEDGAPSWQTGILADEEGSEPASEAGQVVPSSNKHC